MMACEMGFLEIVELLLTVESINKDAVDQVAMIYMYVRIHVVCSMHCVLISLECVIVVW